MTETSEPDLRIAGLRVWVEQREHPASQDYWDGNWLRVRARCAGADSEVRAAGPLVHLSEIATLQAGCEKLLAGTASEAGLYCVEPNLKLELWSAPGGGVVGKIRITPDHRAEIHDYGFAVEAAAIAALSAACGALLERFPLRGKPARAGGED